jgi:dCTP diphosphatase
VNVHALQEAVTAFAREREWEQFHDVKNLSMALASEVGELNAVLRWVRSEHVDAALAEQPTRDALRTEIGDVGILLLLLCARAGIRLDEAVLEKLESNALKYPARESRGRSEPPRTVLE